MVTVRDLEGSVQYRIGPRERRPLAWSIFMQGIRFDAQGNLYLAGTYTDTLYFSPDVVLAPSRSFHDAYMGCIRGQLRAGRPGALGTPGRRRHGRLMDFERAVSAGRPLTWMQQAMWCSGPSPMATLPPSLSAAEDGVVLAHYGSSDGAQQRIQTLRRSGNLLHPFIQYAA